MKLAFALILSFIAFLPAPAFAKGCIKGAMVGGVAGHYAGHHAVLGAVAGCAIGHHRASQHEKEEKQQHPGTG